MYLYTIQFPSESHIDVLANAIHNIMTSSKTLSNPSLSGAVTDLRPP